MFDLGWSELLVIGVVALIVVGPKDLPKMFRTLGQVTAKARSMAREFSRAMEDAADQSGVKDVARDLRGMTNPQGMGLDELKDLKNWDPMKEKPKTDAKKSATASASTPGDDEDEIDRIAAEMDDMRSAAAKRAAPKPSDSDAAKPAKPAEKPADPAPEQQVAQGPADSPKGSSTDSTT